LVVGIPLMKKISDSPNCVKWSQESFLMMRTQFVEKFYGRVIASLHFELKIAAAHTLLLALV